MKKDGGSLARCLVMAGAGGRLGVHLGSYAALREVGLSPDLVIGTCGGALVAALVHAEPDPARALEWLASPQMHRFWQGVRPRPGARLLPLAALLFTRLLDPRVAPHIPDLEAEALFETTRLLPALPAATASSAAEAPEVAIVAARLLQGCDQDGQPRQGRLLFAPVAFISAGVRECLGSAPVPVAGAAHARSAIARQWEVRDGEGPGWDVAARLSMTDMTYLAPARMLGDRWLGGAVDLLPVELASRLAAQVWMDRKDPMPRFTFQPAWRAVLGLDARARQREADAWPVACRVDHRGLSRALPTAVLMRRLRPLSRPGGHVFQVQAPVTAAQYRALIEQQVDEGRRRMRRALALLDRQDEGRT